jgi:hypothetical protein
MARPATKLSAAGGRVRSSLLEDIEAELARAVPIHGGETITAQRWILRLMVSEAAKGDRRAAEALFGLKLKCEASQGTVDHAEAADAQAFSEFVDREIARRAAQKEEIPDG